MRINRHALTVIRERSGMSISELASVSGIKQPHLSLIESGKRNPSPKVTKQLADALRVSMPTILAMPDDAA